MELLEQTDEINELLQKRERKQEEINSLREEGDRIYREQYGAVVETLYSLQEGLEEDESVVLMESEEWSRGGHYSFREMLTPEGVVATDVERVFHGGNAMVYTEDEELVPADESSRSNEYEMRDGDQYREATSGELYGWNHEKEPLDIEEEYLAGRRDTAEFVDKLSLRLSALANNKDRIPTDSRGYD